MLIAILFAIALYFVVRGVGTDVDPETGMPPDPGDEETQEVWEFE